MKQTALILVTLFITSVGVFAQKEKRLPYELQEGTAICDTIYTLPDVKAQFPGGTSEMYNFFKQNLKYSEKLTTGLDYNRRLMLRILIDEEGKVVKSDVLVSISADYDKDAQNAAAKATGITPAKVKKRSVCSYLIIPLYYE